jgi:hypothetical protein
MQVPLLEVRDIRHVVLLGTLNQLVLLLVELHNFVTVLLFQSDALLLVLEHHLLHRSGELLPPKLTDACLSQISLNVTALQLAGPAVLLHSIAVID